MKFKKIISMILCCVMLMSLTVTSVFAALSGKCGENVSYSWDLLSGKIVISGTGAMYDERGEWSGNTLAESVEIRSGVTTIGEECFYNCSKLNGITIPSTVEKIGEYAFAGCSKLTSVELPSGITEITAGTFMMCTGLKSVRIPKSVTRISTGAFSVGATLSDSGSLTDIYYEGSRSEWENVDIWLMNDALKNATIHCEGKENFTGVTFSNKTVTYDGTEKSISVVCSCKL